LEKKLKFDDSKHALLLPSRPSVASRSEARCCALQWRKIKRLGVDCLEYAAKYRWSTISILFLNFDICFGVQRYGGIKTKLLEGVL